MNAVIRVGCLASAAFTMMALLPMGVALLASPSSVPPAAASTLDIPADVLGALEFAARVSGVPWSLLAGIASVATDFGRHAPDGKTRSGDTVFPVVRPPITGPSAGDGIFLLDPAGEPGDLQDVAAEALLVGDLVAGRATERPWPGAVGLPEAAMSQAAVAEFWRSLVAELPLRIPAPAQTFATDPMATSSPDGGVSNPIQQFAQDLLGALGDPINPNAVGALAAWAAGEGSCAHANPLDTTQPEPGATPFNTLGGGSHVWNYPSLAEGVQATVDTLRNGLYQNILTVLADNPTVASLEAAVRASPWGTIRFGSSTYSGVRCPASSPIRPAPPVASVADPSSIPALIVARAGAYQAATSAPAAPAAGPPTRLALTDIPPPWMAAIASAADRFFVPWSLVAAVLKDTCDFGRAETPGCQGPAPVPSTGQGYAQISAPTWRRGLEPDQPIPRDGMAAPPGGGYATDGDADGVADPWSVADATASCARLLADLGAGELGTMGDAAFAYLHGPSAAYDPADGVTAAVLSLSAAYGGEVATGTGYTLPVDPVWYEHHPDWFARPHHDYPAVDIPVPAGTAVYAVTSSTVIAADEAGGRTDCGHDVRLRDAIGAVYTYCHGSQVLVSSGQHITSGQLIMRSGWSGSVVPAGPAGTHLHFQINLPGVASALCPQPALSAWATGKAIDVRNLPTTGCVSNGQP